MRRISGRTRILAGALLVFLFLGTFLFLNVGRWLKGNDRPTYSQAIIVLSGPPTRSLYAADLWRQGYVKDVYITRPIREGFAKMLDDLGIYFPRTEQMHTDVLLKKGVSVDRIHLISDICKSTVDEAEAANKVFRGKNCMVQIVTSPYHVKRAQMIFQDKMKECRFRVLPTPHEPFPDKWWTDQDSARNVILEVSKIVFYKFGGRFENSGNEIRRANGQSE